MKGEKRKEMSKKRRKRSSEWFQVMLARPARFRKVSGMQNSSTNPLRKPCEMSSQGLRIASQGCELVSQGLRIEFARPANQFRRAFLLDSQCFRKACEMLCFASLCYFFYDNLGEMTWLSFWTQDLQEIELSLPILSLNSNPFIALACFSDKKLSKTPKLATKIVSSHC